MDRRPWVVPITFMKALEDKNIKHITSILDSGFDIDTELMPRKTAISISVSNGWLEMAEYIIHKGCSLSLKNERGETPLHLAVLKSDYKMVKLLLQNRADVTSIDELGRTALHHACELDNLRIVCLLIDKSNSRIVNIRDNQKRTPLMYACKFGCAVMQRALLAKGADVNVKDCHGEFPLIQALPNRHCSVQMIQTLLDAGANINERNNQKTTALLLALKICYVKFLSQDAKFLDICLLLIERGSNVNAKSGLVESVLQLAVELHDENLVRKVLNYGCDVELLDSFETLELLAQCSKRSPNILDLLMDSGATFKCVYNTFMFPVYQPHTHNLHITPFVQELARKQKDLISLRHLCRCTIRRHLLTNIEKGAKKLPLPPSLVDYLTLTA